MSDKNPSVPSAPRTDPANVPDVPATRDTDSGRSSDQLDRERNGDPMRTTHPGEPAKRSDR